MAYRRRWWVLAAWAATFVAALTASTHLTGELKSSAFVDPEAPSQRSLLLMQERLHNGMSRVTIVFGSGTLEARSPEFQAAQAAALAGYTKEAFPELNSVQTYASTVDDRFISKDGQESLVWLVFDLPVDELEQRVPEVKAALRPSILTTHVTGEAAVIRDLEVISSDDVRRAESTLFPVALLLLLLIFGSVFAAVLPIVGGGSAVAVTLGALALLAPHRDLSAFTIGVAALMGLGEGIIYSLLTVSRFREELQRGRTVPDAVEETMARAGWVILVSGSTVVVCLLGLISFQYTSLNSLGVGGSLVVTFSVLAALTLQPALLGVLGTRVNSWHVLWRPEREGKLLGRWSRFVAGHPWRALATGLAVVVVFAWPIVAIKVDVPDSRSLPAGTESRVGDELVKRDFDPALLDPIELLVTWDDTRDPFSREDLAIEYAFGRQLLGVPGVAGVTSIVNIPVPGGLPTFQNFWPIVLTGQASAGPPVQGGLSPAAVEGLLTAAQRQAALVLVRGTTAPGAVLYEVKPGAPPASREAQALAARLRDVTPPEGARISVTGTAEGVRGYLDGLTTRTPWVATFVILAALILLTAFLRSPVLGLVSVIASGLSLAASFGVLVWIFQLGHFDHPLGFESVGSVDGNTAVVLFCLAFGLSMDYQVLLLGRVREAWSAGAAQGGEGEGDGPAAVALALAATGRVILSSALIVVVAGSSFAFTGVVVTKAIGVGLAVAIAIDAVVVRLLLVPAALCLLDRRVWWPGAPPVRKPYSPPTATAS